MKITQIMDNQRFTNILLSIVGALIAVLIWWIKTAYTAQLQYNEKRDIEMSEAKEEINFSKYRVNRLYDIHGIPRE